MGGGQCASQACVSSKQDQLHESKAVCLTKEGPMVTPQCLPGLWGVEKQQSRGAHRACGRTGRRLRVFASELARGGPGLGATLESKVV